MRTPVVFWPFLWECPVGRHSDREEDEALVVLDYDLVHDWTLGVEILIHVVPEDLHQQRRKLRKVDDGFFERGAGIGVLEGSRSECDGGGIHDVFPP